jgi:hypothetical protein
MSLIDDAIEKRIEPRNGDEDHSGARVVGFLSRLDSPAPFALFPLALFRKGVLPLRASKTQAAKAPATA